MDSLISGVGWGGRRCRGRRGPHRWSGRGRRCGSPAGRAGRGGCGPGLARVRRRGSEPARSASAGMVRSIREIASATASGSTPDPPQGSQRPDHRVEQHVGPRGHRDHRRGQHQRHQVRGDLDAHLPAALPGLVGPDQHRGHQHRRQAPQGRAQRQARHRREHDGRGEHGQRRPRPAQHHQRHAQRREPAQPQPQRRRGARAWCPDGRAPRDPASSSRRHQRAGRRPRPPRPDRRAPRGPRPRRAPGRPAGRRPGRGSPAAAGRRRRRAARPRRGASAGRAAWWARRRRAPGARWPARPPARGAASARPTGRAPGWSRARPARCARATRRAVASRCAASRTPRRSESATSSTAVGMTSWASGSVNTNPTPARTCAPCCATSRPRVAHPPGGRRAQPVDQPGQGRLAGAVRPDDRDAPLGQGERGRVQQDAVLTARGGDGDACAVQLDHASLAVTRGSGRGRRGARLLRRSRPRPA